MTEKLIDDKQPTPDPAEQNAFFPSPYSLSQFTSRKSDLAGADYPAPYRGGRVTALLYWVWTRLGFRYGSCGIEGTQHGGAAGTGIWEGRLPSLFRGRLGAGMTQAG